jgi:sulfur carrier protein
MVALVVNGHERRFEAPLSVEDLLRALGIEPAGTAVELNREIIPRRAHEKTELRDGDVVEIVTLVGGG